MDLISPTQPGALPSAYASCAPYGAEHFTWHPEAGYGTLFMPPSPSAPSSKRPALYDRQYWLEYQRRDATFAGAALTAARLRMVRRHVCANPYDRPPITELTDFGIGGGRFMLVAGLLARGYDINPCAVRWLKSLERWVPWYRTEHPVATFWDSLEHLRDPAKALRRCTGHVFVSLPVFVSREDVLASRHFKPGEHLWYFTPDGFVDYMRLQGFECLEHNDMETQLGRSSIGSFAFRRIAQPASSG